MSCERIWKENRDSNKKLRLKNRLRKVFLTGFYNLIFKLYRLEFDFL